MTVAGTTTVKECSAATTGAQQTTIINPGGPIKEHSCTKWVTETIPWGCTITAAATTETHSVDCGGCEVMKTRHIVNSLLGNGPECFGGRKTVTDMSMTAKAKACKVTPAPGV